eukprot:2816438-Prymnesium_polylepis.2
MKQVERAIENHIWVTVPGAMKMSIPIKISLRAVSTISQHQHRCSYLQYSTPKRRTFRLSCASAFSAPACSKSIGLNDRDTL